MDEELHWFSMVFREVIKQSGNERTIHTQCYMGWPSDKVTMPRIAEARGKVKVDPSALMLTCSYLGCMTRQEFTGKQ